MNSSQKHFECIYGTFLFYILLIKFCCSLYFSSTYIFNVIFMFLVALAYIPDFKKFKINFLISPPLIHAMVVLNFSFIFAVKLFILVVTNNYLDLATCLQIALLIIRSH